MEEAPEDVLGLGLSPGYKFQPHDDELVEYFLLPRILRQQLPLQGMILEDDPLSAPPWELLGKHKRKDDEAFFFANGQPMHDNGSRRQKRQCVGGGYWEGQQVCVDDDTLRVHGIPGMEEITWKKYMLNYHHPGVEGSMGWVMHEYSITAPVHLASSSLRLYRIRFSGHGKSSKRQPDDDGGAQARAEQPDLLDEDVSTANSVFPIVDDEDEDGGSARPAAASNSEQDYQQDLWVNAMNNWPEQDSSQDVVMPDSVFFPGADVVDYLGPGAASSDQEFLGGNTMNFGAHSATPSSDQGAPGVMTQYDGTAPAAGMLPFGQGSYSGAIDESFMDFELLDQDINIDELLAFPDQFASEAPLHDQYYSAVMQTQSSMQLMPAQPYDR